MTINLNAYIHKRIIATFQDGTSREDTVKWHSPPNRNFPFVFAGVSYTKDGRVFTGETATKKDIVKVTLASENGPFCQDTLDKMASLLKQEILAEVQEFPDWDYIVKQRIRDSLYRKLGNLNESVMEPLVNRIYAESQW